MEVKELRIKGTAKEIFDKKRLGRRTAEAAIADIGWDTIVALTGFINVEALKTRDLDDYEFEVIVKMKLRSDVDE